MANIELQKKLNEELKGLYEQNNMLIIVGEKNRHESVRYILNHLVNRLKLKGVYISSNKTDDEIIDDIYGGSNVDKDIFYIVKGNFKDKNRKGFYYLEKPGSTIELSIVINDFMNSGMFQFLFFDSYSDLLIFNFPPIIENFTYYLTTKLNEQNIKLVALCSDNESSSNLVPRISNFFQKTNYLISNFYKGI